MVEAPVIVWFRDDLRLADNPALTAAVATGRPVLPLFILDDAAAGPWRLGKVSRWWLHHSLAVLGRDLASKGAPLLLRRGHSLAVLPELVASVGAAALFWNRRYEPWTIAQDEAARHLPVATQSFAARLIHEPAAITQGNGAPYRVFTPFFRLWSQTSPTRSPLPAPARLPGMTAPPRGDDLDGWRLVPDESALVAGLRQTWTPGEAQAVTVASDFIGEDAAAYRGNRDRPAVDRTSRLSPHLRFGELGPLQLRTALSVRAEDAGVGGEGQQAFVRQLAWREFAHHCLVHTPEMAVRHVRPAFERFPWAEDEASLVAWQQGRTGYPIVDAGMRQLLETGWMHTRVRLIVGSFLTKHLLVSWQQGAAWFWERLVDADLAGNSFGWQWIAGCGYDAAPYFRVFNPLTQGQKVDSTGAYVRRWVPELAGLPDRFIHEPRTAPPLIFSAARIELGRDYPYPIVEHAAARDRALAAWRSLRIPGELAA